MYFLVVAEGPGSISNILWYLPPDYNTFRRDLRPCYYTYRHQAHMWYTDILLAFIYIYILIYMKYIKILYVIIYMLYDTQTYNKISKP